MNESITYMSGGESHGPAMTCMIKGLPAGFQVNIEQINFQLWRRQQGYGRGGRMKIEQDKVAVLSGLRNSMTLASPVTLMVQNKDFKNWQYKMDPIESDVSEKVEIPRPGHADYPGIKKYGFEPKVYGDLRNSRQIANLLGVYTNANYIEYLGHGDWFWYTPSLYGIDMYSKAIDVAHAKEWVYEKPSIFLTSACLMGRTDGIPPNMNIGITMLHAGCNCFVGATRETGQEAGLTIFENHLIVDDFSIGEALRGEKRVDREPPTYYVRVLYGDPAFNPYEPNNGFSNQGIPT